MNISKLTTKQVIQALPEPYKSMAGQTFTLPNSHRAYIRVRIKDLETKPCLYLFDTDTNSFVSSLYYNPDTNRFIFDYSDKEERHFYSIDTDFKLQPENLGYYKSDPRPYEAIRTAINGK